MHTNVKRTALTLEMIDTLPKIEPHIHIGAIIRPPVALKIGLESGLFRIRQAEDGFELDSDEFHDSKNPKYAFYHHIFKNVKFDENGNVTSLEYNLEYLKKHSFDEFDLILGVLGGHRYSKGILTSSEDAFLYILRDYLQQCHDQNIICTEIQLNIDRLATTLYPDKDRPVARQKLYSLINTAQQEFSDDHVSLYFINCFNKAYGATSDADAQKRANKAVDHILEAREIYPNLIVGINCAGAETDVFAKPENLIEAYNRAREAGIKCDVHWGEAKGADLAHAALVHLPLDRASHFFQSEERPDTLKLIRDLDLTLVFMTEINVKLRSGRRFKDGEPCTKANGGVAENVNNIWEHQIWDFMRKYDIKIAIGSDDPELIATTLKKMFIDLAGLNPDLPPPEGFLVLSSEEASLAQLNAIESSFCPDERKQEMAQEVLQWMWKYGIDVEHELIKDRFLARIPELRDREWKAGV